MDLLSLILRFIGRKINPQTVSLKPLSVFHSSEMLNTSEQRFGISDARTSFCTDVQMKYSYEAIPPLNYDTSKRKREIQTSVLTVTSHDCDSSRNVSDKCNSYYPADKHSQCHSLQDDSVWELVWSLFDLMCENEENDSSCIEEKNILISAPGVETEDKDSEPYCMKIIRNLQACLAHFEKDLLIKENEVIQHKHYFETDAKELISSYNFDEANEYVCNQFCEDQVNSCDELLANINKDKDECKKYSENLLNIWKCFQ